MRLNIRESYITKELMAEFGLSEDDAVSSVGSFKTQEKM